MKPTIITIAALSLLASCCTRSDPTFMNNAGLAINGGLVASPLGGAMMSPGLQNRNRVHPFFGAQ
jgi:hypothetical protein